MNETKPVPTYIGAFLKGGCVCLVVFLVDMGLDKLEREVTATYYLAESTIFLLWMGGCAGLFIRWNYKKHFKAAFQMDELRRGPTQFVAFFKGACVGFLVFTALCLIDESLLFRRDVYIPALDMIYAFLTGGCVGLFLRWNYRNHFIIASTPTMDAAA